MVFNPIKLANRIEKFVCKNVNGVAYRRYYRFRGGKWYGGISTGDCVGCNLRCKFCWSWGKGSFAVKYGNYYSPQQVFNKISFIARKRGYKFVRVSGGEPTIGKQHLIQVLNKFSNTNFIFILETNGLLIGYYEDYAKDLSKFKNLVVRVSIKGTSPEEFEYLTGASKEFFKYQLKAIENLINYGFEAGERVYPAIMLSFSKPENIKKLIIELRNIDPELPESIDPEYVILYPHVKKLLERFKLKPWKAYEPNGIPKYMI